MQAAATLKAKTVLVNLSGRGDKDLGILENAENAEKANGKPRAQR
jgi:tryptophan synthase beta subunit